MTAVVFDGVEVKVGARFGLGLTVMVKEKGNGAFWGDYVQQKNPPPTYCIAVSKGHLKTNTMKSLSLQMLF